jgi:hypothetical protein
MPVATVYTWQHQQGQVDTATYLKVKPRPVFPSLTPHTHHLNLSHTNTHTTLSFSLFPSLPVSLFPFRALEQTHPDRS